MVYGEERVTEVAKKDGGKEMLKLTMKEDKQELVWG